MTLLVLLALGFAVSVWRGWIDLPGVLRLRTSSYPLGPGEGAAPDAACVERRTIRAVSAMPAVAQGVPSDRYVQTRLETGLGEQIDVLAEGALPVEPGTEVRFVFDRRHRLRAIEVPRVGVGLRLPVRAEGGRSPFAWLGLAGVVPAVLGLLVVVPIAILIGRLQRGIAALEPVVGTEPAGDPAGIDQLSELLSGHVAVLLAIGLLSAALLFLRSRPPINRDVAARLTHACGQEDPVQRRATTAT